eukprot:gene39045-52750_t
MAGEGLASGAGTVRTLSPGTTFTLEEGVHAGEGGNSYAIVRVLHLAHNNLSSEVREAAHKALGACALAAAVLLYGLVTMLGSDGGKARKP